MLFHADLYTELMENIDTKKLWTLQSWLETYTALARERLKHHRRGSAGDADDDRSLRTYLERRLNEDCGKLLEQRANDLRNSDKYIASKFAGGGAGLIPFVGPFVARDLGKSFAKDVLRAFGMGDQGPLEEFQKVFQGKFNSHTELAFRLTVQLLGESMNAMAMDASFHGASEVVHIKPVVGQAVSATVKYQLLRKKMINMISTGKEKATVLHLGAVVPQVVFNVL